MKIHFKKENDENNTGWNRVVVPIVAIFIFTFLVILQRRGVVLDDNRDDLPGDYSFTAQVSTTAECLLIVDKEDVNTAEITPEMEIVLQQMKITYDKKDVAEVDWATDLFNYRNVVISFSDWDKMEDGAEIISRWILTGGHLMCDTTPYVGTVFKALFPRLGIESCSGYTKIKGISLLDERMIGSYVKKGFKFSLDGEEGGLDISLGIQLSKECDEVVASEDGSVPLIWGHRDGSG